MRSRSFPSPRLWSFQSWGSASHPEKPVHIDGRVCPERRGGPGARGWASVGLWSHLSPPLSVQAELLGECQAVGHRMDWLPCRPVSWEPLQLCPLGTGHQARLQAARWRDVTPSPPGLLRPLWAQALLPAASSVEVT